MIATRPLLVCAIFVAALSMTDAGIAASAAKAEKTAAEAPPAAPAKTDAPSAAPFMEPLGRLASILGSVHFLRGLCGDANATVWRDKMNELLAAQAPNAADREILTANFNNGYRAFASVYRRCTPAARLAVNRYQTEGATLSRDIAGRYGN